MRDSLPQARPAARLKRRLLIGIGNPDRGDDGAGRAVARRLARQAPRGLEVRECSGEAVSLLEAWRGFDEVTLVDACRAGDAPGTTRSIPPDEARQLATLRQASTHALGVAEAIGLARALGRLPDRLSVYAIEAGSDRAGAALSPAVERAVAALVARLRRVA